MEALRGTSDVDAALDNVAHNHQWALIALKAGFDKTKREWIFVDVQGPLLETVCRRYDCLKATSPNEVKKLDVKIRDFLASEDCKTLQGLYRDLWDIHRELVSYGSGMRTKKVREGGGLALHGFGASRDFACSDELGTRG